MIAKKVRLRPTKTQEKYLFQSAGTHRYVYNWTINRQEENIKLGNKFINNQVLRKEITQMKKHDKFDWLSNVSNDIAKQAVKDACNAYKRYFKGISQYPKFKTKKKSRISFYNDPFKIQVKDKNIKLAKIGWIKTSEHLPTNVAYYNPRITFDNKYWYISLAIEDEIEYPELNDNALGIDLGISNLAICSDGSIFKNINKTKSLKKKEQKLNRLKRKVSRKYQLNKQGDNFVKTNNIKKLEKQISLLHRSLSNIRQNHLHQATTSIVKTKPRRIVIEDLNIKGMLKTKHLAKSVVNQCFYELRRQLKYKTKRLGIELVIADRFYPSSKMCNACGVVKKELKLTQRVYQCQCGYENDRDMNAALNLAKYKQVS